MTSRLGRSTRRPLLVALVLGALFATSANASTTSFKAAYTPVNTSIRALGNQIGSALQTADRKTDAQLAVQFGTLATKTLAASSRVAELSGAPTKLRGFQSRLANALASAASDLGGIRNAALAQSVPKAQAALKRLVASATRVKSARDSLARALGLG